MKKISLFIISVLATLTMFAQENCDCDEIEQENIKLAEKIFQTKTEFESVDETSYICQLAKMPDKTFNALSERYQYNYNFQKQREQNSKITNYFMLAENDQGEVNLFCENIDYEEELKSLPENVQNRLKVIDNTIKMYQDIIEGLSFDQQYNGIDATRNGVNLIMKHIKIPKHFLGVFGERVIVSKNRDLNRIVTAIKDNTLSIGKDMVMDKLLEMEHNGIKYTPIENKTADIVSGILTGVDIATSPFVPARAAMNKCIYWKLFESLPEAGKILGDVGAIINVQFRKKSYNNMIEKLEQEKQLILNTKQL